MCPAYVLLSGSLIFSFGSFPAGSILAELGKLVSLLQLDLTNNDLSGESSSRKCWIVLEVISIEEIVVYGSCVRYAGHMP